MNLKGRSLIPASLFVHVAYQTYGTNHSHVVWGNNVQFSQGELKNKV